MLGRCKEVFGADGTNSIGLGVGVCTGYESFADAFSDNDTNAGRPFQYFAISKDGATWEYGFGYLSDSVSLIRNTVIRSSAGAATAANFASEGNYISASPFSLIPTLPTVYTGATTRLINTGYEWYRASNQTTGSLVADRIYYAPFRYDCADSVDGVWFMNSAGTAGNMLAGIYTMQPSTGLPFYRITKTPSPVSVTATGAQVMPFPAIQLQPGWYYLAINIDSTAASSLTFRCVTTPDDTLPSVLGKSTANATIFGFYESHTYDGVTIPRKAGSTLTALSADGSGFYPILGLRVT